MQSLTIFTFTILLEHHFQPTIWAMNTSIEHYETAKSWTGFQVKSGSYNVVIRNHVCYNVVEPCMIVYDDYDRGRNLIDGNLAINAGTDDLEIQCTSGTTITNIVVINAILFDCNGIDRSMSTPTIGAHEYSTTNNSSCMITNSGSSTAAVPQYLLIR
ncbi:unnamed protein product [Rotaria socialis]|uniref:Uncharacterized protein n=1 Tax=Rotaria socialis TaxID=392032 RepID=A0A820AYZ3_9BILA|nr:unnamed protein product [Rotaria socialis]CAF4200181.1 unnamed protein product [Rotaria socialis]CAF4281719.1 unnamed protein product [Rotaria socialis]CAF4456726.1 unnamed protein product [Rotaria socialis]CAF4459825.1 unnamed protein product [Rotaria socialis]